MELDLKLMDFQDSLRIERQNGKRMVFDPLRRKFLVLTPEELVRQLLVQYFVQVKNYPSSRISIERSLVYNSMERRFDALIYDPALKPFLLVECKAPAIHLDHKAFGQIAQYNMVLQVPYLLVTNGLRSYCCAIDFEHQTFEFLSELPSFPEIGQ